MVWTDEPLVTLTLCYESESSSEASSSIALTTGIREDVHDTTTHLVAELLSMNTLALSPRQTKPFSTPLVMLISALWPGWFKQVLSGKPCCNSHHLRAFLDIPHGT